MKKTSSNSIYILAGLLLILSKLWLVSAHQLMAWTAPHDDLLFIQQAHALLSGNWLGEYNQLTLIKGPFYPIFIAFCYYLNISLLTAQQLLYALASFVAVRAFSPLIKQKWLLLALFALVLLNPFSYNYPAVGRAFRLGIYPSLGLLVLSCATGLVIRSWLHQTVEKLFFWSAGTGIFLAAFWNTREESVWLLPSFFLLLIPAVFSFRGVSRSGKMILAGLYILPVLMLLGTNFTLKKINQQYYGVNATIELETQEFKSAYGGLLRIRSDKWRRFFPVVKDARKQAYKVSPTFQKVAPYLEGPLGQNWQKLCGCGDIPAAFFIWAFRDAVAAAGYYTDGKSALKFYEKMGDEINQGCKTGRLDCRPRFSSLVPPWHKEYNKLLLPTWLSVLKRIVQFTDFSAHTDGMLSRGSSEAIFLYKVVTHDKLLTSKPDILKNYPEFRKHLNKEKTRILNDIGAGYQNMIPWLFLAALIVFCFRTGRNIMQRKLAVANIAAGAALTGILSISFILTLLIITSYSEIERAMHSAYPMVLLFLLAVFFDSMSIKRT
ncbi:MAG: hypothetical protein D3916_09970 [Candidatus Electrothrix sp. MAN1_4]|nr:hypothetical protein [Candidatus Electrothrix sp. MAN1_4]